MALGLYAKLSVLVLQVSPTEVVVREEFELTITLRNPLKDKLTGGVFHLEAPGVVRALTFPSKYGKPLFWSGPQQVQKRFFSSGCVHSKYGNRVFSFGCIHSKYVKLFFRPRPQQIRETFLFFGPRELSCLAESCWRSGHHLYVLPPLHCQPASQLHCHGICLVVCRTTAMMQHVHLLRIFCIERQNRLVRQIAWPTHNSLRCSPLHEGAFAL